MVRYYLKNLDQKNVCISGGVGMNCKMNGAIANIPEVEKLHIMPASGDNGTALGAAFEAYEALGGKLQNQQITNVYYGPTYTNEDIKESLEACKIKYRYCKNTSEYVDKKINENKIVGWFQGRLELGARAL